MMKSFVLITILLLPIPSLGAEVLRFKYVDSVYSDVTGTPIRQPEGIACSDKSVVVISDTANGRMMQYTAQDGTLKPGAELKAPQGIYPLHARMNSRGEVYVLDGKQRRIAHIDAAGEFKGYLEPAGVPGPAAWIPKNLAIGPDDALYILDIYSARVLVLSPEGKFLRQIALPQADGFFSDLAVDSLGTIFLLNSVTATVFSAGHDAAGFVPLTKGLKEYINFPTALAVDKKNIYVVDQNGSGVVVLAKDGSFKGRKLRMGWKQGELRFPSDICLGGNGEVFVADRGNNRVQVYIRQYEQQ